MRPNFSNTPLIRQYFLGKVWSAKKDQLAIHLVIQESFFVKVKLKTINWSKLLYDFLTGSMIRTYVYFKVMVIKVFQ